MEIAFSEVEIIAESNKFHVSNVTLYQYLDEARQDWYKYCIFNGVEGVLVHISTDFKKEIFDQDVLKIRTWIDRVGNTSFTLKQTVINHQNDQVANAEVVLATIDREKRTKVRVPDEVKSLLNDPSVLDIKVLNRIIKKS